MKRAEEETEGESTRGFVLRQLTDMANSTPGGAWLLATAATPEGNPLTDAVVHALTLDETEVALRAASALLAAVGAVAEADPNGDITHGMAARLMTQPFDNADVNGQVHAVVRLVEALEKLAWSPSRLAAFESQSKLLTFLVPAVAKRVLLIADTADGAAGTSSSVDVLSLAAVLDTYARLHRVYGCAHALDARIAAAWARLIGPTGDDAMARTFALQAFATLLSNSCAMARGPSSSDAALPPAAGSDPFCQSVTGLLDAFFAWTDAPGAPELAEDDLLCGVGAVLSSARAGLPYLVERAALTEAAVLQHLRAGAPTSPPPPSPGFVAPLLLLPSTWVRAVWHALRYTTGDSRRLAIAVMRYAATPLAEPSTPPVVAYAALCALQQLLFLDEATLPPGGLAAPARLVTSGETAPPPSRYSGVFPQRYVWPLRDAAPETPDHEAVWALVGALIAAVPTTYYMPRLKEVGECRLRVLAATVTGALGPLLPAVVAHLSQTAMRTLGGASVYHRRVEWGMQLQRFEPLLSAIVSALAEVDAAAAPSVTLLPAPLWTRLRDSLAVVG
jgi:hypothetical protein